MGSAAKLIVQTAVRPADIRRLHYELHYNRPAWLAPAALVVSAAGSAAPAAKSRTLPAVPHRPQTISSSFLGVFKTS